MHSLPYPRLIEAALRDSLEQKLVLLSGPRQVGKTFLSKHLFLDFVYMSYDADELRSQILKKTWKRQSELIIFDELHKMKNWKRWLKGIYDTEGVQPRILVTGSARLDTYRKAGDSLAGRHFLFRLHPFSIKELSAPHPKEMFEQMLELGSFPEPLLGGSTRKAALWRRTHLDVILRQDLLDLEKVREIKSIEILVQLLSERVGSTLSYASLARDLQVSPHTLKKWVEILESLFVIFVVRPFSRNLSKAHLKEPKIYFYDTGRVKADRGARIENLVACHLLKRIHFLEDTEGHRMGLHYIRDKEKREVDFAIEENGVISHLIEVKESDLTPSSALFYYADKIKPKYTFQLVLNCARESDYPPFVKVRDLATYLAQLET